MSRRRRNPWPLVLGVAVIALLGLAWWLTKSFPILLVDIVLILTALIAATGGMKGKARRVVSLVAVVVLAVANLAYTFAVGNAPLLGLDLQGGLSVVLKPKNQVADEQLEQAIAIIRQRIDAIGVAEPEISKQGGNILIAIPGVENRQRALELVGQTAELRFRPVLCIGPPPGTEQATVTSVPTSTPATPGASTPGASTPAASTPAASTPAASTPAPGGAAVTTAPPAVPTTPAPSVPATQQGALGLPEGESAAGFQTPPTITEAPPSTPAVSTPAVPGQTPASSTPGQTPASLTPEQIAQLQAQAQGQSAGTGQCPPGLQITPADQDKPDQTVVLPQYDENDRKKIVSIMQLGPADATGNILEDASAGLGQNGSWVVRPRFKSGADGIDKFNASAQKCKPPSAACPTGRQAITLDGRVISAPNIEPGEQAFKPFSADQVEISGGFTEETAKELATQLKYGALPVELEQQEARDVSATLGRDALHAGLVSGLVGLAIVALYMMAFYRMLGFLAVIKLGIEGALLWSFIAFLGTSAGLALTLAGVTGIIVSIGVSLDSNVVYYEHLKEDVRNGRTMRSAVDRAFASSIRTILKADGVSILGATLLYMLSVGPVRGFAFYLIVSMVLDLFTSYFYMHPVVALSVGSKWAQGRPGLFGLPGEVEASRTTLGATARGARATDIPSRPSKKGGRGKDVGTAAADGAASPTGESDSEATTGAAT